MSEQYENVNEIISWIYKKHHLEFNSTKYFLDLGCGDGNEVMWLSQNGNGLYTIGVDIKDNSKWNNEISAFSICDMYDFIGCYDTPARVSNIDYILINYTMYTIDAESYSQYAKALSNIIKPNGYLFIGQLKETIDEFTPILKQHGFVLTDIDYKYNKYGVCFCMAEFKKLDY